MEEREGEEMGRERRGRGRGWRKGEEVHVHVGRGGREGGRGWRKGEEDGGRRREGEERREGGRDRK